MINCTALYLPSSISTPIEFSFDLKAPVNNNKEGFYELADYFKRYVAQLGKTIPFPSEIASSLDDDKADRLLMDCELIPERTFFILTPSEERFISILDGKEYRMIGNNGDSTMFRTLDGTIIDVIETNTAMKIFGRVKP